MNASCLNVRELIPLFPDDLDSLEVALVREHVTGCGGCAAELGVFAAQAACFAQVREGRERVDLLAGIQEKLARPTPAGQLVRFPVAARALVAAAAAGVVVAFGLFAFKTTSRSASPTETAPTNLAQKTPEKPAPAPKDETKSSPRTPSTDALAVSGGKDKTAPEHRRHNNRSPRRRAFEDDGAMPNMASANGGERELVRRILQSSMPRMPGMDVGERELIPLDEEAELPQAQPRKKTFAAPQPANPNNTPKSSEEDTLRF